MDLAVPTGNKLTDTTNGFFMTMNENVDVFAAAIRKDPRLQGGFNCAGFSQVGSFLEDALERSKCCRSETRASYPSG